MGLHGGADGDGTRYLPAVTLAVLIIGTVTFFAVLATTVIVLSGTEAPEGLVAVASGGVGSLSTFLARTRD